MPYLPLKEKPYTNVDSVGNPMAFEKFIDADKDDFLNNIKRKGLEYFVDLNTDYPVDGLFYIKNKSVVMAVSKGRLYKISEDGTVEATGNFGDLLNSGINVSFADFGEYGYFANNSKIVRLNYDTNLSAFIPSDKSPNDATFIGFLDQYLLALRANSARFDFSDTGLPEEWRGEFAVAESRPDNAVALFTAFGEIFIPGTSTIENWADTGNATIPFQKMTGTLTERGSRSPYSVVQIDNSYIFLDSERRVIRMAGRNPQVISNPFDNEFQNMNIVEDAVGINFNAEGDTKYIINFPSEKRTFVYDYKRDFWAEWSTWNTVIERREHWVGNVGTYCELWNKYLIGSRNDSKIYIASKEYPDDDGEPINTEMWTGRINWGTDKRKASVKMRLKLRRGPGIADPTSDPIVTPKLLVSKRDNGDTEWSTDRVVDLGLPRDTETTVILRRLGTYRDRQWRFKICEGQMTLVSAEEEFEVLE